MFFLSPIQWCLNLCCPIDDEKNTQGRSTPSPVAFQPPLPGDPPDYGEMRVVIEKALEQYKREQALIEKKKKI